MSIKTTTELYLPYAGLNIKGPTEKGESAGAPERLNSIQLFHACSGNSQNYGPEVLGMTCELLPEAKGNSSQVISSTEGQ